MTFSNPNLEEMDEIVKQILQDVVNERARQDRKFGAQNHPPERWMVILMEEVGEVSNAILEHDISNYEVELIQVAAVAVAALEAFRVDKRKYLLRR